jgi:DNA polymerase III epsilon subunit-like protein
LSSLLHGLTVSLLFPAKTFEEVQGTVAELMKDRILIGHAIQNDLKVSQISVVLACTRRTNSRPSGTHALASAVATSRHSNSGS